MRIRREKPQSFVAKRYNTSVIYQGGNMTNLSNALHELHAERTKIRLQLEKLDQAISAIQSLNGTAKDHDATGAKRVISAASRRKMALAQKARWAKVRKQSNHSAPVATDSVSARRTISKHAMSAAARKKIADFQKARWAKVKAAQKKAA